ncbi:AMP-binding protein [Streptomyces stramineus]
MSSFVHCLREQARRYADTRWFAFVESRRGSTVETGRLTYTGLERRARDIGARLAGAGVTDQPVLLLYPAGLEFLSAFFGCLFARAVAVPAPLPTTDPRALDRAEAIIRDTGIRLILTDRGNQAALRQWLRGTGLHVTVSCLATETTPPPASGHTALPEVTAQTTAYLQYTSGSTGAPRGVAVSHANLLHNSQQIHTVIGSPTSGTGAGWLPHYHDMGLVGQLLQPLYTGGNMVFTSPLTFVARPAVWLQMISRYRAAFTLGPNFAYEWLVRSVRDEDLRTLDISCLEWALNGAETVRASTLRKTAERLGPIGFRPQAWAPAYGLAESTLLVTGSHRGTGPRTRRLDTVRLAHHRAVSAPATGTELVSSGRPVGADLRIVDPGTTTPLPDGHVGEIWVAATASPRATGDASRPPVTPSTPTSPTAPAPSCAPATSASCSRTSSTSPAASKNSSSSTAATSTPRTSRKRAAPRTLPPVPRPPSAWIPVKNTSSSSRRYARTSSTA